ncbi:MAG: OmpA family protein [Bdellovibrionales bacterium]|nr:OmpA family protein [Bdellovibrionales bacterium]
MKSFKNTPKILLLGVLLTLMAACSSGPVVQDFPVTANPTEEIANLENDLKNAEANQASVLSPKNYEAARAALEDAKENNSNGKDAVDTLHYVAVGKAFVANANAVTEVARNNMEDVLAARQAAVTAGAPAYFGKEFGRVDADLKDVGEDLEKNKVSKASKERAELQQRYLGLELMAIKEKHLGESKKTISLAKIEKAEKFAPRTLAIAEKSYVDTEAFITANRHNTQVIDSRATETKEAAMHALSINRTARGTDKVSSEETALTIEQEKMRVAAKDNQLNNVRGELSNTRGELQNTQNALEGSVVANSALMSEQEKLEANKQRLESEKQLNEKYEAARKQFANNEAEVYKQGNALLIRLKGMEFPSAKATIQPKNRELLSKVQKVMDDFGTSNVVVEGHTDSVGGKASNDRLSQHRADAVKSYLQSNAGAMSPSDTKIEAVGYGYQKPLATNKTADGRAQNRRVDIVIKPEASKL